MAKYKFIDLFAGIGGFHLAFHKAGAECVFASEWDESARLTYETNFSRISPALFKKENFVGEGRRAELPSERRHGLGVIQIARVHERSSLRRHRSRHALVRVSEAIHGDARGEIQKLPSLGVPQLTSLPSNHDLGLSSSVRL